MRILPLKNWAIYLCTLLICCAWINTGKAQVKFSASCNEHQIAKNEFLQIQFKIENASSIESLKLPDFKNFEVVSGPSRETGYVSYNGNASHYDAIGYLLKPLGTGQFTIPPATAIINGKEFKSNSLRVVVSKNAAISSSPSQKFSPLPPSPDPVRRNGLEDYILRPGEDATAKAKKNLKVELHVSETTTYVGEPIVVSFKLYSNLRSQTNVTSAPSFNGFSVSELDAKDYATETTLNGKPYNMYVLRKVQLYPLQAGKFMLEPLESNTVVTFFKNDPTRRSFNDLFDAFSGGPFTNEDVVEKTITLKTDPVTINVKPLPSENVPQGFKGAVGNFKITTALQSEKLNTDDAGNLLVTISGTGNIQLVNVPEIEWPQGLQSYDPKIKESLDKQSIPITGSKTFIIPFTISKAGDYSIPPVNFSWFNPETGKYQSMHSEPIYFKVTQGKLGKIASGKKVSSNASFISLKNIERTGGIVLGAGIVALALVFLLRKKKTESDLETKVRLDDLKADQESIEEKFEIPVNPLVKVHEKLMQEDANGFYKELESSLKNYLALKLNIPLIQLSKARVLEELDKCNVSVGTANLLETLMQETELSLYARHSHMSQMRNLYEKASQLIALLDKQIC